MSDFYYFLQIYVVLKTEINSIHNFSQVEDASDDIVKRIPKNLYEYAELLKSGSSFSDSTGWRCTIGDTKGSYKVNVNFVNWLNQNLKDTTLYYLVKSNNPEVLTVQTFALIDEKVDFLFRMCAAGRIYKCVEDSASAGEFLRVSNMYPEKSIKTLAGAKCEDFTNLDIWGS